MKSSVEFRFDAADTGRINVRLDQFPRAVQQRLKETIGQLTQRLLAGVQASEPVRTGRLRQATHAFVDEGIKAGAPWVRGRVRVLGGTGNLGARFAALEYGGPGLRRRGQRVEVKAYSRAGVRVGPYTRKQPRITARRFLRNPARAMQASAVAALEAAINDAIAKF